MMQNHFRRSVVYESSICNNNLERQKHSTNKWIGNSSLSPQCDRDGCLCNHVVVTSEVSESSAGRCCSVRACQRPQRIRCMAKIKRTRVVVSVVMP